MIKGSHYTKKGKIILSKQTSLGLKKYYLKNGSKLTGRVSPCKGQKRPNMTGTNHPNWKGGVCKTLEYKREHNKKWRIKNGIGNKTQKRGRPKKDGNRSKMGQQAYRSRKKNGGPLSVDTVQLVYEDNIKRYGTLTCYLCLKSIVLGEDCLEHKLPLSRGGTNEYNNLGIAHRICNNKKYRLTDREYIIKQGGLNK